MPHIKRFIVHKEFYKESWRSEKRNCLQDWNISELSWWGLYARSNLVVPQSIPWSVGQSVITEFEHQLECLKQKKRHRKRCLELNI